MENAIREHRKRAGMTQGDLAQALGVGVPQVSRWENGSVNIPSNRLIEISLALSCSVGELLGVQEAIDIAARDRAAAGDRLANAIPFKMEGASAERMRRDLPIYGTALGAALIVEGEAIEQTFLNTGEVVGYAKRPVILDGNASAYGLYVAGSSMEPRHMDGEMLVVDPKGRVRTGEDVVVYLRVASPHHDNGEAARIALVKRLVRRSSTYIDLEQFSPAKVFRVEMEEVVRIDRVIPWSELIS